MIACRKSVHRILKISRFELNEIETKLAIMRKVLEQNNLVALRLRGVDWFSWATGGGSNVVILTSETGVAEVFVTKAGAWILTDVIEGDRLSAEEIPEEY